MKLKYPLSFAILLIIVIFLTGCGQKQTVSTVPTTQSESTSPETEITAKGAGGAEIKIAPSTDNVVSGIVTISMTSVPAGTGTVGFGIKGPGVQPESDFDANIGIDTDKSNGFGYLLDTTQYQNGLFEVYSITAKELKPGNPPTGGATAQIMIQN